VEEKVSLPIKTKIAAWWMIIIGIGLTLFKSLLWFIYKFFVKYISIPIWLEWKFFLWAPKSILEVGECILIGYLFYFCGSSLLKGKRKFWWISIILLSTGILYWLFILRLRRDILGQRILFPNIQDLIRLIFLLIPFILLLLDRKNFWKIAK